MNIPPSIQNRFRARGAFSLIELMVAGTIGLIITGSAMMLLFYSSRESVRGISNATVEETAYIIQNNLMNTLRTMSAANGMTADMSSTCYDTNGNLLGYNSIYTFTTLTNGSLKTSRIYFDTASNNVVYIPDMGNTNSKVYWGANSKYCTVRKLYFNSSYNNDGSVNSALVNVFLQLDDNSYSTNNFYAASLSNNPCSIFRTFSVLMKAN